MTIKEKEEFKMLLLNINKKMPMGQDYYDEYGSVMGHKSPTKEALAIADMAGILYKILDVIEVAE